MRAMQRPPHKTQKEPYPIRYPDGDMALVMSLYASSHAPRVAEYRLNVIKCHGLLGVAVLLLLVLIGDYNLMLGGVALLVEH